MLVFTFFFNNRMIPGLASYTVVYHICLFKAPCFNDNSNLSLTSLMKMLNESNNIPFYTSIPFFNLMLAIFITFGR